jgi:hypothetical protein
MKLTEAQIRVLVRAYLRGIPNSVPIHGSGEHAAARALKRRGLVNVYAKDGMFAGTEVSVTMEGRRIAEHTYKARKGNR